MSPMNFMNFMNSKYSLVTCRGFALAAALIFLVASPAYSESNAVCDAEGWITIRGEAAKAMIQRIEPSGVNEITREIKGRDDTSFVCGKTFKPNTPPKVFCQKNGSSWASGDQAAALFDAMPQYAYVGSNWRYGEMQIRYPGRVRCSSKALILYGVTAEPQYECVTILDPEGNFGTSRPTMIGVIN